MEPQPGDSLVDLLDQLHDIVEPPPVSMMPATWGWAVVGAAMLAVLGLLLWLYARHRRATAYRRAALAELDMLAPRLEAGDATALAAAETLLRRTALAAFPRAQVATLTGSDWLAFLDRTGGDFAAVGPALAAAPYAPAPAFDGAAALRAARHWIARHHA
jgi:hypothetical protein